MADAMALLRLKAKAAQAQQRPPTEQEIADVQGMTAPRTPTRSMSNPHQYWNDWKSGLGDAAFTLGDAAWEGIKGGITGGYKALMDEGARRLSGSQEPMRSREIVESSMGEMRQPTTEMGSRMMTNLLKGLETIQKPFTWSADRVQDTDIANARSESIPSLLRRDGGNIEPMPQRDPASFVPALIKSGPDILGTLMGGGRPNTTALSDVARVSRQANDMGVNLSAPYQKQIQQLSKSLKDYQGGTTPTEGMKDVQTAFNQRRLDDRQNRGAAFDEARNTDARISTDEGVGLVKNILDKTRTYVTEEMPKFNAIMRDISELQVPKFAQVEGGTGRSAIISGRNQNKVTGYNVAEMDVNRVLEIRTKINNSMPNRGADGISADPDLEAVLSIAKKEIDTFLKNAYEGDLVRGDPAAIVKWQEAIKGWADHMELFEPDAVLTRLQNETLTAKEVKDLILGANAVTGKGGAERVFTHLKQIFGEDSQEWKNIQYSALADIMKPVISDRPNFEKFTKHFDNFVWRDTGAAAALFGEETLAELGAYAAFVKSIDHTVPKAEAIKINPERMVAVFTLGHGIAQAGAKVSIAQKLLGLIRGGTPGGARKARILEEILGYDAMAQIRVPFMAAAVPAATSQSREPRWETPEEAGQYINNLANMLRGNN